MTFEEKVAAIEEARKTYPEFNQEFVDYLGLGHSFNGAYNHFSMTDIKKYEKTPVAEVKVVEPVKPKTTKPAAKS